MNVIEYKYGEYEMRKERESRLRTAGVACSHCDGRGNRMEFQQGGYLPCPACNGVGIQPIPLAEVMS